MSLRPQPVLGANAERSRSHNRQLVLGRVREAGRTGRAEIARASGLSTQAVSNIIAELLADGLIVESGRRAAGRGLPAVQYALNPPGGYALGVEIRPDAVLAALLDLAGRPVFSARRALAGAGREAVTATVAALRDAALAKAGVAPARLLGAGIALPGPFGATGLRDSGSDLPGWEETDVRGWFEAALGLPVWVENDANAAAMAERISGAAQGMESYAFLYFGTGLGLGVVHRGRLLTGAFGNAGEIGHIPVPCDGATVALEDAVSRLSAQRHLRAHGRSVDSGADLARLHAEGDAALAAWLARAAEPLSAAIAIVENIFDPEAVILGGALPAPLIDHLIGAVALPVRSVANRADRAHPRLLRGTAGRMTATCGAAALVINQAVTPVIAAAS